MFLPIEAVRSDPFGGLNLTWVLTNVTRPLLNGTPDTGLSKICIRMGKPNALSIYVFSEPAQAHSFSSIGKATSFFAWGEYFKN